jgi:hypothetical protein
MALPFEFKFNKPDDQEVPESTVITLRTALNQFCRQHNLDERVWQICRQSIKYGDVIFQKVRKPSGKMYWRYIDPHSIIGILVDEKTKEPVYYQLKLEKRSVASEEGGSTLKNTPHNMAQDYTVFVPAHKILHFGLDSEMSHTAPFGVSVLHRVYRVWRQLSLFEDSLIIYRVVRAPERRIFYIDVGKMSPVKSKQYLSRIKTEIQQKRIPSPDGGTNKLDNLYNAASMQEDFFIAQTADGRGSRIDTLPAGANLGELADLHYFQDKLFRGLRVPVNWMTDSRNSSDAGAGGQVSDGRVGVALIGELRFSRFVMRLQRLVEDSFNDEFKSFLQDLGVQIDPDTFDLKFPEPENFALYRESEVLAQLFSTFSQAEGLAYISKRWAMMRFLGLKEDDLQVNEALLKQERGIAGPKRKPIVDPVTGDETGQFEEISELRQIYDPSQAGGEGRF